MKAINVITDKVWEFDKNTTPEWAVRYAWAEENSMLSFLFSCQQDDRQDLIERHFPVVEGNRTVMIGDIGSFRKI